MGLQEDYKGYGFSCGQAWGNDVLAMIGKGGSFWSGSFYTMTPGQWAFYALSLDADGNQRLYVNGQMVGDALTNVHMVQTMANMIIGRHYANTGEGWWFCGAIDEIRLYSRALSAEEVNVLYGEEILEAPADVLATDGSYIDKVRITWDSVTNATGYEVWRAAVNALGLAIKLADTVACSYDDASATAGSVYYYWVKATNATSTSSFSDSDTGYAQVTIAPPSGVSASDGTYTDKVRVSWNSVSGATGYELWRGADSNSGAASLLADVAETMFDDISVITETRYCYWVKAKNSLVTSAFSLPDSGYRAMESVLLLPPADVTATTNLMDKVTVSWQAAAGAASYELYRNTAKNSAMAVKVSDAVDTTYDDTCAAMDTAQYYWIKSRNASGVSAFSSPALGMRLSATTGLNAPNDVNASDGTYTNKVLVAWNSVSGATAYDVWRACSNSTAIASQVGTTETTSYEDRTVLPNVRCYYWVKARNASGVSGFSAADVGYSASGGGGGQADLAITNFTFLPRKISMGDNPTTISIQLINNGPNNMSFPNTKISFDFYLSRNASWGDGDDLWIGEHLADYTLAANNYALALLSQSALAGITIPSESSGNYYVFARVSHALPSTLLDVNGNNNVVMRSGPILVSTNVSRNAINDFDGDGISDLAVFRASDGLWFAMTVNGTMILWGENWGASGLVPVPGDFDGDGRGDLAVYHEATGGWYIRPVGGNPICWGENWGGQGFRPMWGDYDGDGKSDLAMYHEKGGYWFIKTAGGTIVCWATQCGGPGFTAVPGDYNGDGQADLGVYYEASGTWYALTHSGKVLVWGLPWGGSGFTAVQGDYDGDGKADHAVYCEAQGLWYVMSANGTPITFGTYCGGSGYKAVPGDYDGDGKSDLAVYETASGKWYILALIDGGETSVIAWGKNWGGNNLVPVGIAGDI